MYAKALVRSITGSSLPLAALHKLHLVLMLLRVGAHRPYILGMVHRSEIYHLYRLPLYLYHPGKPYPIEYVQETHVTTL